MAQAPGQQRQPDPDVHHGIDEDGQQVTQHDDDGNELALGRIGDPLNERGQKEADIANKGNPAEESQYAHISPKIWISEQNTIILPQINQLVFNIHFDIYESSLLEISAAASYCHPGFFGGLDRLLQACPGGEGGVSVRCAGV